MASTDGLEVSLDHVFEVSSALRALKNDVADEMSDADASRSNEPDTLFTFTDDQVFAHDVATGVWMSDAQVGSWCGRLSDDEESQEAQIQNIVAMNHIRRAQELQNAQQRAFGQQTTHSRYTTGTSISGLDDADSSDSDVDVVKMERRVEKRNTELRITMGLIKRILQGRGKISLEHTGAHDLDNNMVCRHSSCTSNDDAHIPSHTYYITISVPGLSHVTCRFCLPCFETMWNGELLVGNLPDPRVLQKDTDGDIPKEDQCACHGGVEDIAAQEHDDRDEDIYMIDQDFSTSKQDYFTCKRRDSVQGPTLHAIKPGILAPLSTSRHAPQPDEVAATQLKANLKSSTRRHKASLPMLSALRATLPPPTSASIGNHHRGSFSPTRFQHLAHHIQPGEGLNSIEKSVLELWKATTKEQFRRIERVSLYGLMGEVKAAEVSDGSMGLPENGGLGHADLLGRDLSEVLLMLAARKDL